MITKWEDAGPTEINNTSVRGAIITQNIAIVVIPLRKTSCLKYYFQTLRFKVFILRMMTIVVVMMIMVYPGSPRQCQRSGQDRDADLALSHWSHQTVAHSCCT